jgi:hypothetical protein
MRREEIRTTPCRTCGEPIAFAVGNKGGFIPCEPGSLAEHVHEGGRIIFEPRLGHRKHACNAPTVSPSNAQPPTKRPETITPATWLDGLPGRSRHEDLRRALTHARDAIVAALAELGPEDER